MQMQNERRSVLKLLLAAIPSRAIGRLVSAQTLSSGVKVAAGQDRFNKSRSIGVSSTTFKVATADTAGALFAMEQANTKPGGPPRHLHHIEDEFWYVLAGEYVIQVCSDQYHAQPGDCV